ncbi:MAG: hypothetical protein ACM3PE_06180 [Deltaproteobacteria bacterium]
MVLAIGLTGLAYVGMAVIEMPHMIKSKLWRELLVFCFLMLTTMIYSFGLILNWHLPNLVHGLGLLFDPVTGLMQKLL